MEIYVLKSGICMALFLMFYKLFLEKESIHVFKRFYLLASLILAFSIPLITITNYIEPEVISNVAPIFTDVHIVNQNEVASEVIEHNIINWSSILWTIYGLGVLFFSIRFILNLAGIFNKIRNNPKHKFNAFINVLVSDTIVPHTFFNYIFLNKQKYEFREIPKAVMLHEQTHARQKHSIDILIIELMQIILWFNPLIYVIKKAIKLNHEFLANNFPFTSIR